MENIELKANLSLNQSAFTNYSNSSSSPLTYKIMSIAYSCKPPNFNPIAILNSLKKSTSTTTADKNGENNNTAEIIVVKIFVTSTIASFVVYLLSFLSGKLKGFLGIHRSEKLVKLTQRLRRKSVSCDSNEKTGLVFGFLKDQANLIKSFGGTAMQEVSENVKSVIKSGKKSA